jgi:hypothetical protein
VTNPFGTQGSQVQILPLRPDFIRFFVLISIPGQVDHRFGRRNLPAFLPDSRCSPLQEVGVVMAIVSGDIPSNPAASQIGTPHCIS